MIILAEKLQKAGNNIIIGAGEEHQSLFRNELEGLSFVNFAGYKPRYSRILPQYAALLLRLPVLIRHIITEHHRLKSIIRDNNIDMVISDNRFGLWNKKVRTVYVTHQLLIPFPEKLRAFERIGISLHRYIIKKYNFCFIPDLPGEVNVSGRLTHGVRLPGNARFIGILSRFKSSGNSMKAAGTAFPHNTLILSGPEPQRSLLREKMTAILSGKEPPTVILEGKPAMSPEERRSGNLIFYSHLPSSDMQKMISESETIISRSGYSMIMELISMNRSALLIPTPGQTEQEYLAGYLSAKGWFDTIAQDELSDAITLPGRKGSAFGGIIDESGELLAGALKELLK
jgi:hypothetical protein